MINKKTIKEEINREIVVSVKCDKCGKEKKFDGMEEFEAQEYFHIFKTGGYGSKFPGDCSRIEFDLCEECMKNILKKEKINYRIKDVEC